MLWGFINICKALWDCPIKSIHNVKSMKATDETTTTDIAGSLPRILQLSLGSETCLPQGCEVCRIFKWCQSQYQFAFITNVQICDIFADVFSWSSIDCVVTILKAVARIKNCKRQHSLIPIWFHLKQF